jgi:hypothetical protein
MDTAMKRDYVLANTVTSNHLLSVSAKSLGRCVHTILRLHSFFNTFVTLRNLILIKYPGRLTPEDFVYCTIREGDNKQIAIGSGFDIGDYTKIAPNEQALTFGDLMFCNVICHTVL